MNSGPARDFGIPFDSDTGSNNAITDITGVWVGHRTLNNPPSIFSGVTAPPAPRIATRYFADNQEPNRRPSSPRQRNANASDVSCSAHPIERANDMAVEMISAT